MSAFDIIRALLLGLREGALEHSCESCRDDADAALDALNQAEATVLGLRAEVAAQDETIATLTRNLAAADATVARQGEALQLALNGIPDPMHPGIPAKFVDGLVCAKIVLMDALGDDDPGDVQAARAALAGSDEPWQQAKEHATAERWAGSDVPPAQEETSNV